MASNCIKTYSIRDVTIIITPNSGVPRILTNFVGQGGDIQISPNAPEATVTPGRTGAIVSYPADESYNITFPLMAGSDDAKFLEAAYNNREQFGISIANPSFGENGRADCAIAITRPTYSYGDQPPPREFTIYAHDWEFGEITYEVIA